MQDKAKGLPGRNLLVPDGQDRAVFGSVYHNQAEDLGQPGREVHYRWTRRGAYKLILPGPFQGPSSYHRPGRWSLISWWNP